MIPLNNGELEKAGKFIFGLIGVLAIGVVALLVTVVGLLWYILA